MKKEIVTTLAFFVLCIANAQYTRVAQFAENSRVDGTIEEVLTYGNDLYVLGRFDNLNDSNIYSMARIDAAKNIYQIGVFNSIADRGRDMVEFNGDLIVAARIDSENLVCSWNGIQWDTLGVFDDDVLSLAVHNNELYAAGEFDYSPSQGDSLFFIAKWNGTSWQNVGSVLEDDVNSVVSHNGELFIGGDFEMIGLVPVNYIAKWDGIDWIQLGSGLEDDVDDMISTSDGLILEGAFTGNGSGSVTLPRAARWNGSSFDSIPGVLNGGTELIDLKGLGWGVHATNSSIIDPFNQATLLKNIELDGGCFFNSEFVAHSTFGYDSFNALDGLFVLQSGSDCQNIAMSGVDFTVHAMGDFNDPVNQLPAFEVPAGSGRSTVYYSSEWAVAKSNGQIKASKTFYPEVNANDEPQFRAGPTGLNDEFTYGNRYHQVWKIDNGLIWDHLANSQNPAYVPAEQLTTYPGNGNVSNAESSLLAPFNDINGNGAYEPNDGEFPLFKGDAALVTVKSDLRMGFNGFNPVGLDILSQSYMYNVAPNDPRYNTVFSEKRFINRSGSTLDTLYLGFFLDFDIGNFEDDYCGSDSTLNMIFAFNADSLDENANVPGYGSAPPAQGFKVLNESLAASLAISINTNLGLVLDSAYWNRALGREDNGNPITTPGGMLTQFQYHGDPNDASQWSELSVANVAGDRRMFASIGPFISVQPDAEICLELAHIFARDSINGTNLTNVTLLKQKAVAVQNWYDQNSIGCGQYMPVGIDEFAKSSDSFSVFPNPSSGLITIMRSKMNAGALQVRALDGRLLRQISLPNNVKQLDIDLSSYSAGTYLISILGELGTETKRVIID